MTEEATSVEEVEELSTQPGRSARLVLSLLASTRALTIIALAVIIVFGAALRFYNVNWDSPAMAVSTAPDRPSHLHPDERFMSMVENSIEVPGSLGLYFDTDKSPFNPYQQERDYVYGTLPLFIVKIAGNITGQSSYDDITQTGRAVTALFDTATILLVFLIGRRLGGRNVGLLASLLYAAAVLPIQHAHFFVVDSYMTFFAAAAIYFAIRIAREGRWYNYGLAGLTTGLAMACKVTAVSLVPVIGLAAAIHAWPSYRDLLPTRRKPPASQPTAETGEGKGLGATFLGLALMLLLAFTAFRIAQPYAFTTPSWSDFAIWDRDERVVDLPNACTEKDVGGKTVRSCNLLVTQVASRLNFNPRFIQDQLNQQNLLSGDGMFPPSVQWIGRTKWIYPLEHMVLWGMGAALGIAAWSGFFYAAWRTAFRREALHLVLLAWVAGYFLFMGGQFSLYMRYFLPVYPILAVLAALLLVHFWQSARSPPFQAAVRRFLPPLAPAARWLGAGALGLVAVATILWALSYVSVYSRPHTRLAASRWMFENIPRDSILTNESWDDALPVGLPIPGAGNYEQLTINGYEVDSERKIAELIGVLEGADYIVLSSARLSGTIPRAPAIYPVMSRYYDLLLKEKLGFRLAAEFTSYPGILGIHIADDAAEESFSVYDHPKVLIFEKTADYSIDRAITLLNPQEAANGVSLTPAEAGANALMLRPEAAAQQQEGGTWSSIFDPESFSNRFPALTWLLAIELMSLALVPLALVVFRSLPDRGYLLTKPLGLLVVAWLVWMGTSVKLFTFSRGSIALVFLLVILIGSMMARSSKGAVQAYVKRNWRAILLSEALFLGAFLAFYWIRTLDPDLWHPYRGGEKPMELAYLNAVTRSTTMPPYDPWFAGGYLNYYYFGQFMTATLVKFSGILPEIGFNLAVPMYFAMTVGAAYSVCFNLAEAVRRRIRLRRGFLPMEGRGPVVAGLAAVVLVAVAGNLHGLYQTAERLSAVSDWHLGSGIPLVSGLVGMLGGFWNVIIGGAGPLPRFDYWEPSRMMPPQSSITEFPFFTFLFADLHAHLMAIPFDIAILGVGLALVLGTGKGESRGRAVGWAGIAVLALLVGALRPINSWDYPPFLLLSIAAVFIGERAVQGKTSLRMLGWASAKAAALVVLSVLFFFPFWRDYHLFYNGFHASDETTPLHQYLGHFGLLLFVSGTLVAFFAWRASRRRRARRAVPLYAVTFGAVLLVVSLAMAFSDESYRLPITIVGLSAPTFLRDLLSNEIPVVLLSMAVIVLLLLLAWRELRAWRADSPVRLFLFAMLGMALILSAAVDILTLDGDIARMNTVFKFYVHIWLLLAIASAFGLWYLFVMMRQRRRPQKKNDLDRRLAGWAKGGWLALLAILLLGSLIYPISGTRDRVSAGDRFDEYHGQGIDGMEFMRYGVYRDEFGHLDLKHDYDAIQWMRRHVEGTPVIVEGQTPNYRWGSRFSIYTGLPTVIGWGWHQEQQRGSYAQMVKQREQQVKDFYSSPSIDLALGFLLRYRVSYVIVGQLERGYYPPEGIAKFEEMNGQYLRLVFENEGTRIYEVVYLPPMLPSSS